MAFIRNYAAASGDPFRFRLPKFIKKAAKGVGRVGKAAFKVARRAGPLAALVPGVGLPGMIAGKLAGKLGSRVGKIGGLARRAHAVIQPPMMQTLPALEEPVSIAEEIEETEEPELIEPEIDWEGALRFARAYGWEGDPGTSRRKTAGSGPKAKAAKKSETRAKKAAGGKRTGPQKRRPGGGSMKNIGASLATGARAAGQALPGLLEAFGRGGPKGAMAHMVMTGAGPRPVRMGFGGSRRRINPTNVKALRRSVRRLTSFENTVKSVRKSLRGLGTTLSPSRRASSARGHRRGCRCVACRAA